MLYVCGNDRDYDGWAAAGNTGWDYNSLLQYFKRVEHNQDPAIANNTVYHSTTGPLPVGYYKEGPSDSYGSVLKTAYTQLGYSVLTDFNARQYNGVVQAQGTTKNGQRCNAARMYLYPHLNRDNLYIMRFSHVTKVLFSGSTATGVNVRTNLPGGCSNIKLYASKEVIVSAGAIGSPKILQLSGIGRAADLTPWNIPVVKDLAVGHNLQDHVMAILFIRVNPDAPCQTVDDILSDCSNYYLTRSGPLTSLGSMSTLGFINTLNTSATYPDIEYIHYRFRKSQEYMLEIMQQFGYKDSYTAKIVAENVNYEIVLVFTTLLNPLSTGTVTLASTDPLVAPKIIPNFLTESEDVATMIRGIKKLNDLIHTRALTAINASFVHFDIEECDAFAFATDDYWRCYIKYVTACEWHSTGTCKMGPSTDLDAVVDKDLRVHGILNLRVADASIMPTVPSSNIQCPCYMIGEKAADVIKAAH